MVIDLRVNCLTVNRDTERTSEPIGNAQPQVERYGRWLAIVSSVDSDSGNRVC